jgi:hypothetical protein
VPLDRTRVRPRSVHLRRRFARLVRRPAHTGRGIAGDAAAPRIRPLCARAGVGIGQRVVRRDIHEQERAQHHREPARFQIGNRGCDAVIRWRAAIGGNAIRLAHHIRIRARDAVDAPGLGISLLGGDFDAGFDFARTAAQIAAEPAHDQRRRAQIRRQRRELIERGFQVRLARGVVRVLRHGRAVAVVGGDDLGRIDELARAGDQRYGRQHILQRIRIGIAERADHLELQLRNAVAEFRQRHVLEHDVGDAAIGRRVRRAFGLHDQRIGQLRLVAGIKPRRELGNVDGIAVRPYAADLGRDAGAQAHRERDRIGIFGVGNRRAAAALAALMRLRGGDGLLELRRPQELPRHAHAAIEAHNRCALGRALNAGVGEPRTGALHALARHQQRVDLAADQRADRAADLRTRDREPQKRDVADQRRAQRRANRAKNKSSHVCNPSKSKTAAEGPPMVMS